LPVPVAARTVGGYRLGRQDFHWGRDDFSAPFALNYVAHEDICLSSYRFETDLVSLGAGPYGHSEVYALVLREPTTLVQSIALVLTNRLGKVGQNAIAFLTCAGSRPFGI
jgi:hypothetical protein